MNLREATAGIRRGHLSSDDFTALRGLISVVATSTPEEITARLNGSPQVGQALIYDLAFSSRDEMTRMRQTLGDQRLTELCVAIRRHIERPLTCPACRQPVPFGSYTCQCGATLAPIRSRRPDSRPTQELVTEVGSGSTHIGFPYKVRRNPDGSLSCDCLGYLNQTHLQNTNRGYAVCRHISTVVAPEFAGYREPSEFQKAMLRSMGVTANATLTNDQAYFLIKDVLDQQGIDFAEYVGLVRQHGKAEGLPIWTVGWEFEGGIRSKSALQAVLPGGWTIASDASVHAASGYRSLEVRAPKLFGKQSFQQLEQVLTACQTIGWNNTTSAGMHTHINAALTTPSQRVALAKAWVHCNRKFIQWLVPAHRRSNTYCEKLSPSDVRQIESQGFQNQRFRDLNFQAFSRHRSIEVRLHHCSADVAEVKNWTIFLLKFFESVMIKGTAPERFREVAQQDDFNQLLSLIGMNDCAVRPVREAADAMRERFARYSAEQAAGFVSTNVEEDFDDYNPPPLTPEQAFWANVEGIYLRTNRIDLPTAGSRVNNLLRRGVSQRESFRSVSGVPATTLEKLTSGQWSFQSETTAHNVVWNSTTDEVSCSCNYFAEHSFCRYSVAVARYLNAIRRSSQFANAEGITVELREAATRVINTEMPVIEPTTASAEEVVIPELPVTPPQRSLPNEAEIVIPSETVVNADDTAANQDAEVRRLYSGYNWSGAANREDTIVPVAVWREAGRRVGRMVDFDQIVTAYNEAVTHGTRHLALTENAGLQYFVPVEGQTLDYIDRLMLRYQLAIMMVTGNIPRRFRQAATAAAPVATAPEQPEAASDPFVMGMPPDVFNRAKRLYDNTRWAQVQHAMSPVPAEAWDAAGRRISRMRSFESMVAAIQSLLGGNAISQSLEPTEVPGHEEFYYLRPISASLSSYGICMLRANLSVLMAQNIA